MGGAKIANKLTENCEQTEFGESQVQVLDRQVLEFWGLTFLKTFDPVQPQPPFRCGGGLVFVHSSVCHVVKERAPVGGARQVCYFRSPVLLQIVLDPKISKPYPPQTVTCLFPKNYEQTGVSEDLRIRPPVTGVKNPEIRERGVLESTSPHFSVSA